MNREKQNQQLNVLIGRKLNDVHLSQRQTHHLTSTAIPSGAVMPTPSLSQDCRNSDVPDTPLDPVMAANTDYSMAIPDGNTQSSFFIGGSPSSSKFYGNLAGLVFDSCVVFLLLL